MAIWNRLFRKEPSAVDEEEFIDVWLKHFAAEYRRQLPYADLKNTPVREIMDSLTHAALRDTLAELRLSEYEAKDAIQRVLRESMDYWAKING